VPQNLTLALGAVGSGVVLVDFDHARRAERYRVMAVDAAAPATVLLSQLVPKARPCFTASPPAKPLAYQLLP
jgi:hypothetical protein